jgi:hypothetical protein
MPIPDSTPARRLVIRRGAITYIVDEAKYDTVMILDTDGVTEGTYKSLGYGVVSAIENGSEVPYVKREHVGAVPGREDVAAEQIAIRTEAGAPVPSALARAANAPEDVTGTQENDEASRKPSRR